MWLFWRACIECLKKANNNPAWMVCLLLDCMTQGVVSEVNFQKYDTYPFPFISAQSRIWRNKNETAGSILFPPICWFFLQLSRLVENYATNIMNHSSSFFSCLKQWSEWLVFTEIYCYCFVGAEFGTLKKNRQKSKNVIY